MYNNHWFGRKVDLDVEINKSFENISRKLFRNSLNYRADFKLFPCAKTQGNLLEKLVQTTLGDQAVVGGSSDATRQEVIDELRDALQYRGDHGSHPSLDYLDSPESRKDFDLVTCSIEKIIDESVRIVSFWLKDGHPFYPVFWDFAFLVETDKESILFIASSSD